MLVILSENRMVNLNGLFELEKCVSTGNASYTIYIWKPGRDNSDPFWIAESERELEWVWEALAINIQAHLPLFNLMREAVIFRQQFKAK